VRRHPCVELHEPRIVPDWSIHWYAEARGRGVARLLAGRIDMDLDAEVGRAALPWREGLGATFHRMLYRHPDRKRFPLRG
jgi:hypothetical protein